MDKAITFDNGAEFALHETIAASPHCQTFFCDPRLPPSQRGTKENFIGLPRDFIPKGTASQQIHHAALQHFTRNINNRPMKLAATYLAHVYRQA